MGRQAGEGGVKLLPRLDIEAAALATERPFLCLFFLFLFRKAPVEQGF
jgi:hypothetical protein